MALDHDIAIVGGGPAGIATALTIAQLAPDLLGRLVVIEKARFPRDKYCAGGLGGRGDRILARLGTVPDVPSVTIDGMSLRLSAGDVEAQAGTTIGRVVRRLEFDHTLATMAMGRGVRIVEGTKVETVGALGAELGAVVRTSDGELTARIVVGADGVGSAVRRSMGLSRGRLRAQVLELDTEPVDADVSRTTLRFDASDRGFNGYQWDFPTLVDGCPMVSRGIYNLRVVDEDSDIRSILARRLGRLGLSIDDYRLKRFAERGFDLHEPLALGPLMLVGEAAGIDPITGEGIAQALEHGWMAGQFIIDCLAGYCAPSAWTDRVRRSRLARDLSLRRRAVAAFYGPRRPALERFLLDYPAVLHLGCRHFGDLPYNRMTLLRVASAGLWRWVRRDQIASPS